MPTPTIDQLQKLIRIGTDPLLLAAYAAFAEPVTTRAQMSALKEHYFNVVFFFDQVLGIVGDERVADYGTNGPNAMIEYIADRAAEAQSAFPTTDEIDYTEPTDEDQNLPLGWIETEMSGSASAS